MSITTNSVGEPTNKVQPKVVASTIGAGVGGAITTLGVYIFESLSSVDLPTAVEGSILTLVAAGLALAAGYIKRPSGVS
jgi:hypothetical protein|tara:strand:- start:20105 stop:20341 length:237 start_codon:yes stop_codon:yes gene_type:complete